MPIIKSAKKKLRQDKKRTERNKALKVLLKETLKKAKKTKAEKDIVLAVKTTDKATKHHIIHKNKAAHIKSALSKLIPQKTVSTKATNKTSAKKAPKKASR